MPGGQCAFHFIHIEAQGGGDHNPSQVFLAQLLWEIVDGGVVNRRVRPSRLSPSPVQTSTGQGHHHHHHQDQEESASRDDDVEVKRLDVEEEPRGSGEVTSDNQWSPCWQHWH